MFKTVMFWFGCLAFFGGGYLILLFYACMDGFAPTTNPILRLVYDLALAPLKLVSIILSLFNR